MKVRLLSNCYVNDKLYPDGHVDDWGDAVGEILIKDNNAVMAEEIPTSTLTEAKENDQ